MRCTRCDRPTIPQAIGVTPAGLFVFGWCVACLDATGCQRIAVAERSRGVPTRLTLESSISWTSLRTRRRPDPLSDRRRLAGAVSLVLSLWGLLLFSVGLSLWALGLPRATLAPSPSAFRVGGPSLLIGGGGATAAVGFLLWSLNSGRSLLRSVRALRLIQGLAFLAAMCTLLAGIVFRSQRRDPLVVGLASAALVVSAAARWIEIRKARGLAAWGPDLQ